MLDRIKALSATLFEDVVGYRRHIHQHPELSFEEVQTSAFIGDVLDAHDIRFDRGWGGHGLVAYINEDRSAQDTIALRADMDALPIQEENDVEYASIYPGRMHACGHDVHTAALLGASIILQKIRDDIPGAVKLIFQPAEEKIPGGASIMIDHGVLDDPTPSAIIGQHVHPPMAVGKIGVRSGRYMASADEIYLTIHGQGGHAALPHEIVDPILIAAHILTALQQVVSRNSNPNMPTVLSFGNIRSDGGATNIIPDRVFLEGTLRTFDETWRKEVHARITDIAKHTARSFGGDCNVDIKVGYPFLVNDPSITNAVRSYAEEYVGSANVVDLPIRMTAEDFAYYSHRIPACFYRLGTGNVEKGIASAVHTSTFDIDEDALKIGAGFMAWVAYRSLTKNITL